MGDSPRVPKGSLIYVPERTNVFSYLDDGDHGEREEFPDVTPEFWKEPVLVLADSIPYGDGYVLLRVLWRDQVNVIETNVQVEFVQRVQNLPEKG